MSGDFPHAPRHGSVSTQYAMQVATSNGVGIHPMTAAQPPSAQHYGFRPESAVQNLGPYSGNVDGRAMMNGVTGAQSAPHPQQYSYHEQSAAVAAVPPRASFEHQRQGSQMWSTPFYDGPMVPNRDQDAMRRGSDISPNQAVYPGPPNSAGPWDNGSARNSLPSSHQSQDPNFAHPHNMSSHGPSHSYTNNYTRPHHRPVEPNAAPSPPTQYPGSPRTPISANQPGPPNGIPLSTNLRQGSTTSRPSLSSSAGPLTTESLNHRLSGSSHTMSQGSSGSFSDSGQPSPSMHSPLAPGSMQQRHSVAHPLGPPTPVNNSFSSNSPGSTNGRPENGVRQQQRGSVYRPNESINGMGRPVPEEDRKPRRDSIVQASATAQSGLRHRQSYESMSNDDEPSVKREAKSRTASVCMSPTAIRTSLPDIKQESPGRMGSQSSPKSATAEAAGKKKGAPVFQDRDGNEYYENETVPPNVPIPAGWQIGTGKHTKGLLLPLVKDGITVNPEWGFTAGGKARQRLPQACKNCRAKKIRCVESDYNDTICSHCMKMRITCQRYEKDEDKKPKKRASQDRSKAPSSDGDRSDSKMNGLDRHSASRKRKPSSEDGSTTSGHKRIHRHGSSSRAGSAVREPLDIIAANASRNGPSQNTPGSEARSANRMLFPGQLSDEYSASQNVEMDSDPRTRQQYLRELRNQNYGTAFELNGQRVPVNESPASSFMSASPTTSTASLSGIHGQNGYPVETYPHLQRQRLGSTPTAYTGTPPLSCPRPLGEDPRHGDLPGRRMLEHLVAMYFKNVFSQTYAFLHQRTFEENMDKHSPVLLYSICAVSARFSEHAVGMEEAFAERTRSLILENYDNTSIEVVQSMVHMGLHDFGSNNGQKAWMFAGMAVRMGAALNLNLETRMSDKSKDPISREVARRTYWSYYLMDRFNSYGVARPFLTQDLDCHVQLPCNQPSFTMGRYVVTEHLLGPNPYAISSGPEFMGAMAYLVRLVGIWGNILRQIHMSGFPSGKLPDGTSKRESKDWRNDQVEFNSLLDKLETWRKKLPKGLQYSNENLAGQIRVGTTGAFVMMHVMWHTAMAYVYRYVRTTGVPKDYIEQKIPRDTVVESIRKSFVHADAVLQIMFHVQQRKHQAEATKQEPVIVNAPFLGQAISDACNITCIRALEVRAEPGGAREQKARVFVGLEWLKELKRYWKPIEGMYKKLRRTCKNLEKSMSQPPARRGHFAPTPESSIDSTLQPGAQYSVDPANYNPQPDWYPGMPEGEFINSSFMQFSNILEHGMGGDIFEEAFNGPEAAPDLWRLAHQEAGFPHLYSQTSMSMDPLTDTIGPSVSAPYDGIMNGQQSIALAPTIDSTAFNTAVMAGQAPEDLNTSDNEDSSTPEKDDINAIYFDPNAVHDGRLGDPKTDTDHEKGDGAASERENANRSNNNRMDVMNLVTHTSEMVATALWQTPSGRDKFTGPSGGAAPTDTVVRNDISIDNSKA